MKKYSFKNDYSEGCHPSILEALCESNFDMEDGYGEDSHSINAKNSIKKHCEAPNAEIHFIPIGTQTNLIAISSILRHHESVICAQTAHIIAKEAGAIEATGCKVIPLQSGVDGKVTPALMDDLFAIEGANPHLTIPKLVYISDTTEQGTFYSKKELTILSEYVHSKNMYLYLDGARLASALMAEGNDVTLADIAALTDMFYIGATKAGALLGEALVIVNPALKEGIWLNIKQRGGTLAKGRLLGIQFETLFGTNLYFDLAKHANEMAGKLKSAIEKHGYSFLTDSTSNQIFPIFPNKLVEELQKGSDFYIWQKMDEEHTCIRLICSWATRPEAVTHFIELIDEAHL